jgi:protoporphyrin/coproporphyrin ferrochelatase
VQAKTGIVMLNMGGPQSLDQVETFLLNLFADRELIQLPLQNLLGPFIARRRAPRVKENYRLIGGGSPILHWTKEQGAGMVCWLDQLSPETAPHNFYVAFRYIYPHSSDALEAMKNDGIERAIAFSQYPQFSCTTTGSSVNELWREVRRLDMEKTFEWSLIDRWPTHPGFIEAVARSVIVGLEKFQTAERDQVLLLFSAHSLPINVINRGDPYTQEIGASMQFVLERLNLPNPYILSYQSEVGPISWQGPSTEEVIRQSGNKGIKQVLVVPIAFTSDHIETLSEIDLEYGELAKKAGIQSFKRAPALNNEPGFVRALADIVLEHLRKGEVCSSQYRLHCPGCENPECRQIINPVSLLKS